MENTVENKQPEVVLDDAVLNPVQETQETISPLSEVTEEQQPQEAPPQKEPGWIRQRVDKAVQKAIRETEARMQAQFDTALAPIRESMMERQADELVAAGEFKSRERALEYVRLKGGQVAPAAPAEQPRDAQGRFTSQADPDVTARANLLAQQANKIKSRGVDVVHEFNTNPDVKQRVLSGEWDFYDVAENMQGRVPAPMRTPNGASIGAMTIANMSDAQFAKLQQNLAAGKTYDAR